MDFEIYPMPTTERGGLYALIYALNVAFSSQSHTHPNLEVKKPCGANSLAHNSKYSLRSRK